MSTTLARTPLHDWHVARGARMVDFGGWSMPVQYTSIVEEHHACRRRAALFDVSHMGRFSFRGDVTPGLDQICTRRVTDLNAGRIRYSLICNEQGGALDDVLVYRLEDVGGRPQWFMVVNASNRKKIAAWIHQHLGPDCFDDVTFETALVAVQGPQAVAIAEQVTGADVRGLKYYSLGEVQLFGQASLVSRTGYTGEDGCEIMVPAEFAGRLWDDLLQAGASQGIEPAGLGARDTLRLEAALPLYGHELHENIGPIQAGLKFAVNLKERRFIGCEAIAKQMEDASLPRRIGLALAGRRVPREHFGVFDGENQVGEVTSGTFSPTLEKPIAMAYVDPQAAAVGNELAVDIRGRREAALVVELPFYRRT